MAHPDRAHGFRGRASRICDTGARLPEPWPPLTGDGPALQRVLAREVTELPRTWQAVVGNAMGPRGRPDRSGPGSGLSDTQQ